MTKLVPLALLATLATLAAIPATVSAAEANQQVREANTSAGGVAVTAGRMLYGPDGNRIASVYRVTSAGDVQIILNGRLQTIAASTLSDVNGKVTTSLAKSEIGRR
jgi:hypothetical protein